MIVPLSILWCLCGLLGWAIAILKKILFIDEPEIKSMTVVCIGLGPIALLIVLIDVLVMSLHK